MILELLAQYADYIIAACQLVFVASLVPSAMGVTTKISRWTSIPTGAACATVAAVMWSLGLPFATGVGVWTACLWFFIAWRRA